MENTKIIKRLIQHYIEGSELTQDEHFEVRSLEKQLAAINYTRCCTELKDKDIIAFHVFAEINKYAKCFEGYKRDGKTFSETEVLKRYNTYLQSL
tara:strand:- start:9 stop:293 length:285 start_codon:yes stop_codon:yes gene_type:complete